MHFISFQKKRLTFNLSGDQLDTFKTNVVINTPDNAPSFGFYDFLRIYFAQIT